MNIPDPLPEALVINNRGSFPAEADDWFRELPNLIADLAAGWRLKTVLPPFAELSYNYVTPVVREDGTEAVLKVGLSHADLRTEIDALRLYDGDGAVRLLDADPARGALLLERLEPGTMLVTLSDDEQATRIAAQVMRRLWRPVPEGFTFPHVTSWTNDLADLRPRFGGGTGPFPPALVDRAEGLFAELFASEGKQVLLHGDLHHYNILTGPEERGGWLAIDPKGILGEAEYEAGALLRNPLNVSDWPNLARLQSRRLDILAETLEQDRARLKAWAIAQAVLSSWWTVSDDPEHPRAAQDAAKAVIIAEALIQA